MPSAYILHPLFHVHSLTLTSEPLCRGLWSSLFSVPQQPAIFELNTSTAPSMSSLKRGLKCSARSSALRPRSIWNLDGLKITYSTKPLKLHGQYAVFQMNKTSSCTCCEYPNLIPEKGWIIICFFVNVHNFPCKSTFFMNCFCFTSRLNQTGFF